MAEPAMGDQHMTAYEVLMLRYLKRLSDAVWALFCLGAVLGAILGSGLGS